MAVASRRPEQASGSLQALTGHAAQPEERRTQKEGEEREVEENKAEGKRALSLE